MTTLKVGGGEPVEGQNAIIVQLGITANSLSAKAFMVLHTAVHTDCSSFAFLFLKVEQIVGCSPSNSGV